jgi:hypothetical protein
MAPRAKTMIDVLSRRKEIEDYLTKLEVRRNEDGVTSNTTPSNTPAATTTVPNPTTNNTTTNNTITNPTTNNTTPAPTVNKNQPVVKQDTIAVSKPDPKKPVEKTEITKIPETKTPAGTIEKKDTAATVTKPPVVVVKNFSFISTDAHYVVLVLDRVDQVYASEAKNAFNRYNKEKYYQTPIEMTSLQLDDRFHLVMQGPFANAGAAVEYIDKTGPVTRSRILPWLTQDKYSFIAISAANLEVLRANKDMMGYRQLLQQAFPGKF